MVETTGPGLKDYYDYKKTDSANFGGNIENDICDFEKERELKCRELLKELNLSHIITEETLNELENENIKINSNENLNDAPKRNQEILRFSKNWEKV